MQYAIIGAGGTGGCLGFFLQKAGKDVTLIARGKHLEAIRKNGLTIQKLWDESRETLPVKACTAEEYKEIPDDYFYGMRISEQPRNVNNGNDERIANTLTEYVNNCIANQK